MPNPPEAAAATATVLARSLTPDRIPDRPPELEGRRRDDVDLVVTTPDGDIVAGFRDLPSFLARGDLLVVNDSATLPASLPVLPWPGADPAHAPERLHLSAPAPDGGQVVEVRRATRFGSLPSIADHAGRVLHLPAGTTATLLGPYPSGDQHGAARLWRAALDLPEVLHDYLRRHGRPIRYGDPAVKVPLSAYQTVFAARPGSSEMPSAARPFTARVLRALRRRGVQRATITLHTGVSSQETGEPPYPEPFEVPPATVDAVAAARRRGNRVIAIGTTVARALETAATGGGLVEAAAGWTDHVIGQATPVRVVDGLLTGWHEPGASHLDLLATVAGSEVLARAYQVADAAGIRWHEFGDSHLLLRDP